MDKAFVTGWRAYVIRQCSPTLYRSQTTCPGNVEYVLVGMRGHHVHKIPPSDAVCELQVGWEGGKIPQKPHLTPSQGCSCGYYGLFRPDDEGTRHMAGAIVWSEVIALGVVVICEKGFRCQNYFLRRLYWPTDKSMSILLAPSDLIDEPMGLHPPTLEETLPNIAQTLGVPLVMQPISECSEGWGSWEEYAE